MPDELHHQTMEAEAESPVSVDLVTGSLEAVFEFLEREDEINAVVEALCRQVVQAFRRADMAGITLVRPTGAVTVAATAEQVVQVDEAQYRSGDGPSLAAARSGRIVRADVTDARERWPDFAATAELVGVHSYLSAPLLIDSEYSGALNLYGTKPHAFRKMDESLLELYVTAAASAVRSTRRYIEARNLVEQLRIALSSRAAIDQAKGIVMALRGIGADDAFDILVARSQRENVKLRVVAERVVSAISGSTTLRHSV